MNSVNGANFLIMFHTSNIWVYLA